MAENDLIEIIPLGGWGEFGMNMMAIRCRGNIVVIDAGLMFPRNDLLGVDKVVPDLSYLLQKREEVRAVILSHGHEDHIGSLAFLLEEMELPVYGTPLTLGLARGRLAEHGVLERAQLKTVRPRDRLEIGGMSFEVLRVTHSIPDSIGLAITTPIGTIIHTGDFKFDQSPPDFQTSDYARFAHFGDQGVLALLSDSTNSERPGYTPSESHVRHHLKELFPRCQRKIIMACFASSIHRIQIILDLAQEFGRKVVPIGRSMKENIALASELGYLHGESGILIDLQEASRLSENKIIIVSTGSQGEPMSALSRLALGKQKGVEINPDDAVIISARVIPGNENRISHLVNHICRRGARVYYENYWMVHASGHGSQEDLKLMLNLTKPRFFIPIHGEFRQLFQHTRMAREIGIPEERILLAETGDIIALSADSIGIRGKAPVGRRLIDQGRITELDEFVVRDRQHISEEGIVLVVVPIGKATGRIEGSPEIISRGHIPLENGTPLLAEAREVILKTLGESTNEERADSLVITDLMRADLKRFFRKRTATRPMIVPVVLEI